MAFNRNGGSGRVVDFKDGQPVYKRGRSANGNSEGGERAGRRPNAPQGGHGGRKRAQAEESGEGGSRYGERSYARGRTNGENRPRIDHRPHRREEVDELRRGSAPRAGSRMEDFPHDIPPRRRRETEGDNRQAYREGRRFERAEKGGRYEAPSVQSEQAEQELPNIIMGRNPVKEAIRSGRSIDRILVSKEHDGSLNEILDLAYEAKLVVRDVDRAKLDEICMPFGHNGRPGNHQGIIAYIPGVEYCELSDILEAAAEKGEPPFVVLLDGVEDPHNLGSIIRSAECAGAHGIVIPKRRSASVTAAVVKTSAGATEHIKIAKVVNLTGAIAKLKEAGVWVAGADMQGESLYSADLKGPFALVVGAEGAGISRLVAEKCDYLVSIPLLGKMESLNASVAAAVIMFEKVRQDSEK